MTKAILKPFGNGSHRALAVIAWESFGPYHFSRLRELAAYSSEFDWQGIEIGWKNKTYGWARGGPNENGVSTLCPDTFAEKASWLAVFVRTKALLKRTNASVVFVPSYWPSYSLAVLLAAKVTGCAVVVMSDSHLATGRNSTFVLAAKRFLLTAYDAAFVAGSIHRQFFVDIGVESDRIFDGYDSVDNTWFFACASAARAGAETVRATMGLPKRFVLSLGRFVEKKNLELVIEAYSLALKGGRLNGCGLVFVGDGPLAARLRLRTKALGMQVVEDGDGSWSNAENTEGYVFFKRFAQVTETPSYYALATCFVLASRREEWGLVVNEAMASGCPVIVSEVAGCAHDLVTCDETGFTFDPNNVNELALCLGRVCSAAPLAGAIAERGKVRIAEWSNARFARNAGGAARAAIEFKRNGRHSAKNASRPLVILQQTCFPDYRENVYVRMDGLLRGRFGLACGHEYFSPDIKVVGRPMRFCTHVANHFFLRRKFLWQSGAVGRLLEAKVAILEMNPRILSNWVVLGCRSMWGAPTLVWGHTWGRQGGGALRNIGRLFMARLASGVVTYTRSQRDELRRVLPSARTFCAPNSLILAEDCYAKTPTRREPFRFIYVGRLNADKRPHLLIAAFESFKRRHESNAELCIVGSGPEEKALRASVDASTFKGCISFLGHLNNKELLRDLYADAVCAVSPGYVGLSAIQAFSYGVPLLLADDEPHAPEVEACIEGFNTTRFKARNVAALGEKLAGFWTERMRWVEQRNAICDWTAKRYSVEAMVDGHLEAIEGVTGVDFTSK